jgi:hypothetical protein
MSRSYVSVEGWKQDFRKRAQLANDAARLRLVQLHESAWKMREKNPRQSLECCQQGAELARQLNEPCWEIFHENWIAGICLFFLRDTEAALDTATRLVAKASRERYAECCVRARAFTTLMAVHYFIDPVCYETEIRDMIEFIEREIPLDIDTHQRLQGFRMGLCQKLELYEQAEEAGLKYLQMSQGYPYREADAYKALAEITYLRRREDRALDYARLAEERARESIQDAAFAQVWQAILHRRRGDEMEAQQLFKRGMAKLLPLSIGRDETYYNMLCRFYEAGKEYEKSLALRDEQIANIHETVGLASTFEAHHKRCLVLRQMHRLTPADVAALQKAAQRLRYPERHLPKLQKLEANPFEMPLY